VVTEVAKLKHELDGEINVPASFQLVDASGSSSCNSRVF
jgi:hypothetical protein